MITAFAFNRNDTKQFGRSKGKIIYCLMKRRGNELKNFAMLVRFAEMLSTCIRTNFIFCIVMIEKFMK